MKIAPTWSVLAAILAGSAAALWHAAIPRKVVSAELPSNYSIIASRYGEAIGQPFLHSLYSCEINREAWFLRIRVDTNRASGLRWERAKHGFAYIMPNGQPYIYEDEDEHVTYLVFDQKWKQLSNNSGWYGNCGLSLK
jgi:hypothetical protein